MQDHDFRPTSRRTFLGTLATGTTALGMATIAAPLSAGAKAVSENLYTTDNPDEWFKKIKGKHRIVFDVTQPHDVLPFAWPRVFLATNAVTGTPEKDNSVVVVLRHDAIPYAMQSSLWEKYKFGEVFKVTDPATKAAALRNPFWQPKEGDFKVPGLGNVAIGINQLQDSGVMFCVCDTAMTVYSAAVAQGMNKEAAEVKKDWAAGLLPNIQVVPSGVWALGRAQEHGCAYCFAG
jgi:intracellular sulfur oxidation DsrE/DsrF family protein